MANLNKVMLIGNLTRDPQLKYTPNQTAVVEFGIATNRKWRGQDGQEKSDVCFVDCVSFGKPAETLNKYMKKGNPIFVEGRLTFDSWTAQDGSKRSRLRVTIENFQFLGGGGSQGQGGASQGGGYSQGNQQGGQQGGYGQSNASAPANANMDVPPAPMDDDIPF